MTIEQRELQINNIVEGVLSFAHAHIWHGPLTSVEARLAWLRVTAKLLDPLVIEQQSRVIKEHLETLTGGGR